MVAAAVFAPHTLDAVARDEAWQLTGELDSALHPGRFSAGRVRALVDPRPLFDQALARWGARR